MLSNVIPLGPKHQALLLINTYYSIPLHLFIKYKAITEFQALF